MRTSTPIAQMITICLVLSISLSACGGQSNGAEESEASPAEQESELTHSASPEAAPTQPALPSQIVPSVGADPGSRWQEITLTVTDANGNPIPDVEVSVEQTDLDFFFDSAYNPNAAWVEIKDGNWDYGAPTSDSEARKQEYQAVGFNTDLGFYGTWWKDFEPNDDDWNNITSTVAVEWLDGHWNPRVDPPLPGTRFFRANLGPSFSNPGSGTLAIDAIAPDWVDTRDKDQFLAEYEEYLREVLDRGQQTIGGYDLYEIGIEANNWDLLPWQTEPNQWPRPQSIWQEWADLLAWEMGIVAEYNTSGAPVCLHLDSMGWDPELYPHHLSPQSLIEYLISQGAPFDCLGFEAHPGSFPCESDDPAFWRRFLDEMEGYGMPIYIWEFAVNSAGKPEPAPDWCPAWKPQVAEYTPDYQEQVMLETFQLFFDDPQVIGVALLDYRDVPQEVAETYRAMNQLVFSGGLLDGDRAPKPAYFALKDYWHSQFTSYSGRTGGSGEVSFRAVPGTFKITVGGQTVSAHLQNRDSPVFRAASPASISLEDGR